MANDKEDLEFRLNLDAKEFTENILKIKEQIAGLGEAHSLSGLVSGLTKVAGVVGVVGVAYLGLKTIVDSVFEADKIRKVETQFESLAHTAGIAGEQLKDSLLKASGGLVDDTELMKVANRALIQMGDSASRFGDVMELSRKISSQWGGDVTGNFEAIINAANNLSEKQLRALGIHVNVDEAIKKYAQSMGVTKDMLTDTAKRQAVLNEALEQGNKTFKDHGKTVVTVTTLWKQLEVTLGKVKEVAILLIEKVFGGTLRKALEGFGMAADMVKEKLTAVFGDGIDQAKAKTSQLEKEYSKLFSTLAEADQAGQAFYQGQYVKKGSKEYEEFTNVVKKRMEEVRLELEETGKVTKEFAAEQKKAAEEMSKAAPPAPLIDTKKQLEEQSRFQTELVRLKEEGLRSQMDSAKQWSEKERLLLEQNALENEKHQARVDQIKKNETLTEQHKLELIEQLNENHAAKMQANELRMTELKKQNLDEQLRTTSDTAAFEELLEQKKMQAKMAYEQQLQMIKMNANLNEQQQKQASLEAEQQYQAQITQINMDAFGQREQMLQRYTYAADGAASQFARGFQSAGLSASNSLMNFGEQGKKVFDMMGARVSNAFVQMGEGSKKGSDVMRDAVLGMIGDLCLYYGNMMLLAGIGTMNPVQAAAGAGLLVLAGVLKGMSKRSSGGMEVGGGGGGDIGGFGGGGGYQTSDQMQQNQRQPNKSVHLEVHGNIFDSDSTRQRITELVRQSIDATDFNITKVGG